MKLSRWTDKSNKSFDDILNNMLGFDEWHGRECDPFDDSNLEYNVKKVFDENQTITLNGSRITYNYIEYVYERIRPGEEDNPMRTTRIYPLSGFIVIYTDGVTTQYIINRGGSDNTKTILRKLNNYNKKLEIVLNPFKIDEDMFIWMIKKVLDNSKSSLEDDSHLLLKSIIGFKGATHDKLAEVKGSGNRIMNLLSTLAFLFENEKVTLINPRIEYEKETIEMTLDIIGTIDIDLENYVGNYIMDEVYERNSKVILMSFLEIIPKIITAYHNDKENKNWSVELRNKFLVGIGENILDKIQEKIKGL